MNGFTIRNLSVDPNLKICDDDDECFGNNTCHAHSTCSNSVGSYFCTCNSGWVGDGQECVVEVFGSGSGAFSGDDSGSGQRLFQTMKCKLIKI